MCTSQFKFTLLSSPRFMALLGLYKYMGKSILRGRNIKLVSDRL